MSTAPTREHQNQGPEGIKQHSKIMQIILKINYGLLPKRCAKRNTICIRSFLTFCSIFDPLGTSRGYFLFKMLRVRGRKRHFLRKCRRRCFPIPQDDPKHPKNKSPRSILEPFGAPKATLFWPWSQLFMKMPTSKMYWVFQYKIHLMATRGAPWSTKKPIWKCLDFHNFLASILDRF